MSLRFCFGPSGAGKSLRVYQEIIERAAEDRKRNFLIIVPDQFTMQTQKELVTLTGGGILNIDVLSFGRLSHRILEEVGTRNLPILDDTGKSLILQKLAGDGKEELPTLGSRIHRQGYIHEVKSAISEFMQYGIGVQDMDRLIEAATAGGVRSRMALSNKLKDLKTLYSAFTDYKAERFITTEEKLDVLRESLGRSRILRGSVVVFDGFTGFTPVQNRLIQELMRVSDEVLMILTLGEGEDPFHLDGEQKLFHLTKKTVSDLTRLAKEAGIPRGEDITVVGGAGRFAQAPALAFLEQNLFRYGGETYMGDTEELRILEAVSVSEEVHAVALSIRRLVREEGMNYRDIAVVVGNLETYAPYVETEFDRMHIPCFLDRTRGLALNPMIEYINSALELYLKDFSYEAVMHYLRSGMTGIDTAEIDRFENYILRTGLRGRRRYESILAAKPLKDGDDEASQAALIALNQTRERFYAQVEGLATTGREEASVFVERLCDFLEQNEVARKLAQYEEMFTEQGNLSKAKEYAQIYRIVMELLEQIYDLLGEEEITLLEFTEILSAGFAEITVGTIPQNVDRIVVGDMERTRLRQGKVLFFLGINDGNIPKSASKGGILSDMDREFLLESGIEMAPSPRAQMFIQRFYLYLNMTKPSMRLTLSYAKVGTDGKSIRPAYLVDTVRKLFPDVPLIHAESLEDDGPETLEDGTAVLAKMLRNYAGGLLEDGEERQILTLYAAYNGHEALRERLSQAAFLRYQPRKLDKLAARALYGENWKTSVSKLETYAACALHHFLQYGLALAEREEFGFESRDRGTIYHAVLEQFAEELAEEGKGWQDFDETYASEKVRTILERQAASYGETVLYSSMRSAYEITRMHRVLLRTVTTLQRQLSSGSFLPDVFEQAFLPGKGMDSATIHTVSGEEIALRGRIDRIDVAEKDGRLYVKVIDYKSGAHDFDLASLYEGLQLQLAVYMNAALELEQGKHPGMEVEPAALLYYHVDDPIVEEKKLSDAESLKVQLETSLRPSGAVVLDETIIGLLDHSMPGKSKVIPVDYDKKGEFLKSSSVYDREMVEVFLRYAKHKLARIGQEVLDGRIAADPYRVDKQKSACTYCAYKRVCGFDASIPGYGKRTLTKCSEEALIERMREDIDGESL